MDEYKNPSDTFFGLSVPPEQEQSDEQTKADVFSESETLQALVDRFTERIALYGSIDGISDEVMLNPEEFMHVIAANKLVVEILRIEKEGIEQLIEQYKK